MRLATTDVVDPEPRTDVRRESLESDRPYVVDDEGDVVRAVRAEEAVHTVEVDGGGASNASQGGVAWDAILDHAGAAVCSFGVSALADFFDWVSGARVSEV